MDCPSEEQMIRMQLSDVVRITSVDVDIPHRTVTVYHTGSYDDVLQRLDVLDYDTSLIESVAVETYTKTDDHSQERKLLWQVLAINFFFFVLELLTGVVSHSMGLMADGLDMLADSIVYGLALYAVGGALKRKHNIATASGYLQLALAVLGFSEVVRRFVGVESVPTYQTMVIISTLALLGNAACLYLLQRSRSTEAHMQASMIFTSNDVIANLGVIVAGGLVFVTNSKYPDLIVGTMVFILVGKGAFRILRLAF